MSEINVPILRTTTKAKTVSERVDEAVQMVRDAIHNEVLTRARVKALEDRVAALEAKVAG